MAPPSPFAGGGLSFFPDMLVAVQFPFADIRPLLGSKTNRVGSPQWLVPQLQKDFVRSFGALVERHRGGVENWAGEEIFCKAWRGVRFDDSFDALREQYAAASLHPECAFRRFLSDGLVVSRFELGIAYRVRSHALFRPLAANDTLGLLKASLHLRMRIASRNGAAEPRQLLQVPQHLAQLYLVSTTKLQKGKVPKTDTWWMSPGTPLALIEYQAAQIEALPESCRQVPVDPAWGFDLHHCRVLIDGQRLGTWFLAWRKGTNRDQLRKLRLNLFRLHAERECFRETLRAITAGRLKVGKKKSEASERLQRYLGNALSLLTRKARFGVPQSSILEAAQGFEDLVAAGDRDTLLVQLEMIRPNLLRSLKTATAPATNMVGSIQFLGSGNTVLVGSEQRIGSQIMRNYSVNFGDHATVHGDFVVAETIQNSFNRVKDSDASEELKQALKELSEQVAEMATRLPTEKARTAAQDLETLTKEVTSPAPRRKWWELSLEGLKDAAKAIGDVAAPVLASAAKVAAFLA